MSSEEAQWPAWILVVGSVFSTVTALTTDWSINLKLIFFLAFINSIHYRLHPRFSKETLYVRYVNPAADYPSRNLWYSLVLSSSFGLVTCSFKDARFHSKFVGAGHFVQIIVDGIGLIIGASYFLANAICVSRESISAAQEAAGVAGAPPSAAAKSK